MFAPGSWAEQLRELDQFECFDWLTEANPRTTRAGPVGWLVFLWAEVMGDPDRIQEEVQ